MSACKFKLTLGRKHFRYAPSKYTACVTDTQAEKLFASEKPKALGCGVFACAYPHRDPTKVVKITRDPSDVAALLKAQGTRAAPTVFEAYQLAQSGRWTAFRPRTERYQDWPQQPPLYALVLERLTPLASAERAMWTRRLAQLMRQERLAREQARFIDQGSITVPMRPGATSLSKRTTRDRARFLNAIIAGAVCPRKPSKARQCERDVAEFRALRKELEQRGIDWVDAHGGNIGRDKNGRWKILDMGASSTRLEVDLPELAGARRAAKRRR